MGVHQMAARRRIQDIEDTLQFDYFDLPEPAKKEITSLGLRFGLATKYTSFIGVDKQSKKSLFEGAMQSRLIEHEIPQMMFGGGMPMPRLMACMSAPPPPPMESRLMACMSAPLPPPMGPLRSSLKKSV